MPALEKGLRYFIIFAVFFAVLLTPFIFSGSLFFPYVVGKAVFFRILATLVFGAWVLLVFLDRRYLPSFNWITVVFGIFMVWVLIANIFGHMPSASFWSNFERMEGYLNLLSVFAFFIVASNVLDSKRIWYRLFNASIIAAGVMAIIALTQYADGVSRADGLLGNPIYLAGYMLFHVFLALFFALRYIRSNVYLAVIYGSSAAFFASLVFVTGTRGAMLGLVAGLFIATFLVAIRRGERKWIRYVAFGGLAIALSLGALFSTVVFINNYEPVKDAAWAQNFNETVGDLPAVKRFSRISLSEGDAMARFVLWEMAIEGIKENPILGIGQENYIHVFNSNFRPELFERETWFDRAHNIFLEWGVAGGIPAMALYVAIFLTAIIMLWRTRDLDHYVKAIFSALFVAHAVQSFFVFENITSHVLFITFLAFATFVTTEYDTQRSRQSLVSRETFKWGVFPLVLVLTLFTTYHLHIKALQANMMIIDGVMSIECGVYMSQFPWGELTEESARQFRGGRCAGFLPADISSRISSGREYSREEIVEHVLDQTADSFQGVSGVSPIGRQEAAELFSMHVLKVVNLDIDNEIKNSTLSRSERMLLDLIEIEPEQTRALLFLGRFYLNIGQDQRAVEVLEKTLSTAPERQLVLITLGQSYNRTGEYEMAHEVFKKAHKLDPSFRDPLIHYAASFLYLGDEDSFERVVEPLSEREILFEEAFVEPLEKLGEYDTVIEIRERRVEEIVEELGSDPMKLSEEEIRDVWSEYRRLIQTYERIDDPHKAIEVAENAGENFPQLANVANEAIEAMEEKIEN